ncbi:MAG: hypothetical protein SR1Q5_03015 [Quinella sp. 1Q5]|nr:hypothetical protein [Quinella sp. 1Q5]
MRKKFVTGAAVLALLMNAPLASADDEIVIFGGEFEDEASTKKAEKPAPKKELPPPPIEEPKPEVIKEPRPIEQPNDLKPEPQPIEQPNDLKPEPQPIEQPNDLKPEPQPIERPNDLTSEPQPIEQPKLIPPPPQPVVPPSITQEPVIEIERPFQQPSNISGERVDKPTIRRELVRPTAPQQSLRTLKQRFIKIAADDTYTYYLDKQSVQWKKMPYMASEYMADVWIRMVEHNPAPLNDDMAYYGRENFNAEVALAREQGYQYSPEDLQVLSHQAYVLEHYYLRPKTNQIQFLCELEVFGRPQNTINERAYDYKNWENLVPGSVESVIYAATLKTIGKGKSSERGHMTFIDMLDEYARIALN